MRNNILRKSVPELIENSGVVIAGLTEHGATIGLIRHTAASVTEKLTDVITAVGGFTQAKATQRSCRIALHSVAATARRFAMSVRDSIKPILGNVHSPEWAEVGFPLVLAVSMDPAKLAVLLLAIKAYLTRHPTAENVAMNLTATRANTLYEDLTAAIDAFAVATYNVATARRTQRNGISALRGELRGVIIEMKEEVDPLSDYWVRFGFNKPGAAQTPEVPQNLTATLIGTNKVSVQWTSAPRAERYRVWVKVNGVDEELVAVGSPHDLDFMIEGLPANTKVEIAVSAVNNGGESQKTDIVTVMTL